MSWLITAYEPFGGAQSNSALLALKQLRPERWRGQVEFYAPVPVTFADAWPSVLREAQKISGLRGILCLGQAEWRLKVTPERLALNWIDARIPDNVGVQLRNQKVEPAAPDLLWSSIPWETMPPHPNVQLSYSAGTYLCNSLMFHTLSWCQRHGKFGGFVHFPLLDSQREPELQSYLPRMPLDVAVSTSTELIDFVVSL